jgi:REP element-mobilizing transposase RayT
MWGDSPYQNKKSLAEGQLLACVRRNGYLSCNLPSPFITMSKVEAVYHIVLVTKNRQMTITESHKRQVYAYIYGLLSRKRCTTYRINGIADHVHLLIRLNPTIALSDLVRDLKRSTSEWLKTNADFPLFAGWEHEYAAFTHSRESIPTVASYIIRQEEHHKVAGIAEEMDRWEDS